MRVAINLPRAELPVDTVSLARYLIGKILVREMAEGVASGRIVETEAYVVGDAAGHAYRGMTPRNRSLFLERGHGYVYLVYGSAYIAKRFKRDSGDWGWGPHQGA
jgi:DNA-3-methyladenine glycosylase